MNIKYDNDDHIQFLLHDQQLFFDGLINTLWYYTI